MYTQIFFSFILKIYNFIKSGKSFESALRTRTFEPDAPNFTPRISGLADYKRDNIRLSILKSDDNNPESCQRFFFEYSSIPAGIGYFIHTYEDDGNPLPSFKGEPTKVTTGSDITSFTKTVWDNLNEDNKVSLFTRFISLDSGEYETRIENKHK